ncbi:MAG: 3-oxoacyl-ACP reductase [Alphaproteobacteria bacterium]|nr:3-oxoacyl-ACP reductase [Alphaproteobacteria bacterium]
MASKYFTSSGLFNDLQQEFYGKSVIVAGGAGGIGAALVKGFHALGAKVVIMDKSGEACDTLVASLETDKKKFVPKVIGADLAVETTRNEAMAEACTVFGPPAAFVSTIGYDQRMDFSNITQEHFELLLRINLIAPVLAAREVIKSMRQGGGGSICLFTSRHGSEIFAPNMTEYGAAKAGLDNGIRHMAVFTGEGNTPDNIIRVFGFCPGWIQTGNQRARFDDEVFEQARKKQLVPVLLQPEDMVMPVIFNLSRFAKSLSGTIIRYDAGDAQLG